MDWAPQPVFPTTACLQCPPLLSVTFHCRILAARCMSVSMPCFPCANFLSDNSCLNDSRFKWLDDTCQLSPGLTHLDFRSSFYWRESRLHEVVNLCRDLRCVGKYTAHRWTTVVSDKYFRRQILSHAHMHTTCSCWTVVLPSVCGEEGLAESSGVLQFTTQFSLNHILFTSKQ